MTTTVRRRPRTTSEKESARGVRRQQDVGVPPGSSIAVAAALLIHDKGRDDKPYCTCTKPTERGFGFDAQMGLYVHADPECWKPSAAMYALALQTRTLEGVLEPKEKEDGASPRPTGRVDRDDVHPRRSRR